VDADPILIGIHGVKRAGKDTTAQFIKDWGLRFEPARLVVQRGFADKAKLAFARQFFPRITEPEAIKWMDEYKDTDAKVVVEFPQRPSQHVVEVEFRLCMAQFSTQGARDVYGWDHWADQLLPLAPTERNPEGWRGNFLVPPRNADEDPYGFADVAAITDLRFENEMERIKELGGLTVKIRRHDAEQAVIEEARARGRDVHESELGIPDDQFDVVINNNTNDMDYARRSTVLLMEEIYRNGIASIRRGNPLPWVIGL
jgi:hypothetical protein